MEGFTEEVSVSTKGQIYHTEGGGEEAWSHPASRQPQEHGSSAPKAPGSRASGAVAL